MVNSVTANREKLIESHEDLSHSFFSLIWVTLSGLLSGQIQIIIKKDKLFLSKSFTSMMFFISSP